MEIFIQIGIFANQYVDDIVIFSFFFRRTYRTFKENFELNGLEIIKFKFSNAIWENIETFYLTEGIYTHL